MTTFLDGPASVCCFALTRVPQLLRVAVDPAGEIVPLDAADDSVLPGEVVYLYTRAEPVDQLKCLTFDARTGTRGLRRRHFKVATYRLHPAPPAQTTLADRDAWRAWADTQGRVAWQAPTVSQPKEQPC